MKLLNLNKINREHYLLLISCLLLIDVSIILLFNFSWREIILLLMATPSVLLAVLKLIVPKMQKKAVEIKRELKKEVLTEDAIKMRQIKIARKEGKRHYKVGENRNHTVYATSPEKAANFYNENIHDLAMANPEKNYFYVTSKYNNI